MTSNWLTIGRIADAAGVNVETVRYYQRIGLVKTPPRPPQGFRHYPPDTVARIRFIKRAQQLGFSLHEIGQLLALGNTHCTAVRQQAEARMRRIEAQIKDLQAMRRALKKMVAECREGTPSGQCPMVDALASPD